ncbi:MAG TPA: hypothetical protein PK416_03110 [Thermodesulfobacteriota bacterium]|nr:hypothetical protein [Thermodesulfobacteriota bacterium]
MTMRPLLVLLAAGILLLSGCPRNGDPDFESSMNSKVGILTYDDAIRAWGPPTNVADGDRVTVAVWTRSMGITMGRSRLMTYASETTNNLTITFDRETRQMIEWRLQEQ